MPSFTAKCVIVSQRSFTKELRICISRCSRFRSNQRFLSTSRDSFSRLTQRFRIPNTFPQSPIGPLYVHKISAQKSNIQESWALRKESVQRAHFPHSFRYNLAAYTAFLLLSAKQNTFRPTGPQSLAAPKRWAQTEQPPSSTALRKVFAAIHQEKAWNLCTFQARVQMNRDI